MITPPTFTSIEDKYGNKYWHPDGKLFYGFSNRNINEDYIGKYGRPIELLREDDEKEIDRARYGDGEEVPDGLGGIDTFYNAAADGKKKKSRKGRTRKRTKKEKPRRKSMRRKSMRRKSMRRKSMRRKSTRKHRK